MVPSTDIFMDALEKWIKAARANDFTTARQHAQNLVINGELLTIRPEFVRCFEHHNPDLDPKEALICLCRFLVCTTDGRAEVLKNWVRGHGPS